MRPTTPSSRLPRPPAVAYFVLLSSVLFAASVVATRDDRREQLSLSVLTPLVNGLIPFGGSVAKSAAWLVLSSGLGLAALCSLFAVLADRGLSDRRLFFSTSALVILAQTALLQQWYWIGSALYVLAAATPALGKLRSSGARLLPEPSLDDAGPFSWVEFACLSLITILAVVLRFYALNRVFDYFEGELSPYMAGSTSLRGMVYANAGTPGPWAPLGYLYYLPIFVTTRLFGATVLSVRLASAVVSALTVPLMYGLLRRLAGREAALFGSFVIAVDPLQVGWGRSDIHPHGSTVWIAILVCWVTVNAAETGRWYYFVTLTMLMGLSWHQYPSGQVAVLIPLVFFFWNLVFRDPSGHFLEARAIASLAAGLALWLIGYPFPYLIAEGPRATPDFWTLFGIRTSWYGTETLDRLSTLSVVGRHALANSRDLVYGLFVQVPFFFHQEFIPPYPGVPVRSVFWVVVAMAVLAMIALVSAPRSKRIAILAIWAVCGVLPAVLSDRGYLKRAAILYPALCGLAAISFATLHCRVAEASRRARGRALLFALELAAVLLVSTASLYQWFSGAHYPYGEPVEIRAAKRLKELLGPGTVVISESSNHYFEGKMTFLMLDALDDDRLRPVAWFVHGPGSSADFELIFRNPSAVIPRLSHTIWYLWTSLWPQLPEIQRYPKWSRVLFLAQLEPRSESSLPILQHLEKARELCPRGKLESLVESSSRLQFKVFECDLSEL